MPLIDIASSKSVWRGNEYYNQNKVLEHTINEDETCDGVVAGSSAEKHHVHVDLVYPRKSTFKFTILPLTAECTS